MTATVSMASSLLSGTGEDRVHSKPSRPRDHGRRRAILDVAVRILREQPSSALSIDGLAEAAGVSKPTIYRWWPNKTAVELDAFLEAIESNYAVRPTESPSADLRRQVVAAVGFIAGPHSAILARVIAHAADYPEIRDAYLDRFVAPRQQAIRATVERGQRANEFRANADPDLVWDMIYAPLCLRVLTEGQPVKGAVIDAVVDHLLTGLESGVGRP